MKKSFFLAALLLSALTISARPYQHSVGINVGGMNGISYKGYVRSSEHFVVIADLNTTLSATKGCLMSQSWLNKDIEDYQKTENPAYKSSESYPNQKFVYWTFQGAANFVYQGDIADWSAASLHWFAGGGLSMGMMQGQAYGDDMGTYYINMKTGKEIKNVGDAWDAMKDTRKVYQDMSSEKKDEAGTKNPYFFKFGLNAIAGLEVCFKGAPLNLSFDFRPGYGEAIKMYTYPEFGYVKGGLLTFEKNAKRLVGNAFFDWTMGLSLRYRF